MKFATTAVALAAFSSMASAASIKHAHQHAHSKKNVEEKRYQWTPPPGYDWTKDPGTVWKPDAAAPAAPAAPAETFPTAASPAAGNNDNASGGNGDLLKNLGKGIKSFMSEVNSLVSSANLQMSNTKNLPYLGAGTCLKGINAVEKGTSFVWLGEDSSAAMVNELVNESDNDVTLVMWKMGDFTQMFVTSAQPAISVKIPSKGSVTVSHAAESGAWSAIYSDTAMSWTGMIHNTWGEFTFGGQYPTFDVSKIPAMSGHDMSITDGDCTSSSLDGGLCSFECTASDDSKGGDWCVSSYHMVNTGHPGCNLGTDNNNRDSGGCQTKAKKIKTTFH